MIPPKVFELLARAMFAFALVFFFAALAFALTRCGGAPEIDPRSEITRSLCEQKLSCGEQWASVDVCTSALESSLVIGSCTQADADRCAVSIGDSCPAKIGAACAPCE